MKTATYATDNQQHHNKEQTKSLLMLLVFFFFSYRRFSWLRSIALLEHLQQGFLKYLIKICNSLFKLILFLYQQILYSFLYFLLNIIYPSFFNYILRST